MKTSSLAELLSLLPPAGESKLFAAMERLPLALALMKVSAAEPEILHIHLPPGGDRNPEDITHVLARTEVHAAIEKVRTTGTPAAVRAEVHAEGGPGVEAEDDGSWVLDLEPVPDDQGAIEQVLLVAWENTEQVRDRRLKREAEQWVLRTEAAAAELRDHAERMAALEKVKGDFLKLASHELRGPLALIRGYVSMMDDGSMGELPAPVRKVLPVLSSKATQMALLLEQMLEAARLEDSALHLHLEDVDLGQSVRRAVEAIGGLALPNQSVLLSSPRAPVVVTSDAARVETIILNLLDNAIKYSPGGGEIQVTVTAQDGFGRVSVKDPGIGIATDDQAQIFNRFGRLVTPENSHIPGTGLGLYLSREIAHRQRGEITVTSSPGVGSTFTLSLPLAGQSTN